MNEKLSILIIIINLEIPFHTITIMFSNQEWEIHSQNIIDEAPPSPIWANNEPFLNIERYKPGHIDLISARAVYIHEYGVPSEEEELGLQKRLVLQSLLDRFPPKLLLNCDYCHDNLTEDESLTCEKCESVWCRDCLFILNHMDNTCKYDPNLDSDYIINSCPDC